jgi:hypothetical protein
VLAVWFTLGGEAPGYFMVFDVQGRRRVTRTVPGESGRRASVL